MKETVTEVEQVEKERQVTICDYCRLVTSEDLDDGEVFGEAMLNPSINVSHGMVDNITDAVSNLDDKKEIRHYVRDIVFNFSDHKDHADLCPGCQDALFGDSRDSMLRTKVDQ